MYPLSIWTALKAPTGGFGIGLKSGGDVTSVTGVTGWADKVSDDSLGCRSTRIKQLARSGPTNCEDSQFSRASPQVGPRPQSKENVEVAIRLGKSIRFRPGRGLGIWKRVF